MFHELLWLRSSTDECKELIMLNLGTDLCVFSSFAGGPGPETFLMRMSSTGSVRKPRSRWYSTSGPTLD